MRDRIKASDWLRAGLLLSGAIGQTFSGFLPDALGWEVSIASRSAEFNTLLIPSGWAFLIWLPLFFGNIAFAIYHAFPKQLTDPLMRAVGWLAAAAFWANAVRSLYQPLAGPDWISFVMLEAILAPLLIAAVIIARAGATGLGRKVALAFVVAQAGWISVASPAGFSQMALYEGWNVFGLNATSAAFAMLAVWSPLVLAATWATRAYLYAGAVAWGLFWVFFVNTMREEDALAWTALGAAAVVLVVATVAKRGGGDSGARQALFARAG